jgi:pimeloyl-ACP methyl ester carboxylesterase
MEPLGRTHRVIAVSLRHFYPEIWDGKGADFSADQHAKDLAVFIRRLDAGPVHLVGHSYGGDVAFLVAKHNPELLLSLTLADPAPLEGISPPTAEALAEISARKEIVKAAVRRLESQDIDGGLERFVEGVVGAGTWRQVPEQMRARLRENAWTVKSLLHPAQISDACADAAAIRVPVLLITGEKSPRPYGVMLQGLAPCLKHRRLATIPNASHTMNRMNPNAFNDVLVEFLANPR